MTTRIFVMGFCIVYLLGFVLVVRHGEWRALYALSSRGKRAYGTVRSLEPQQHGTFMYSFEVGGQTFTERGSPGDGNPELEDLRVGEKVLIYYLPDDPSVSCAGTPASLIAWEKRTALLYLTAGPMFLLIAVWNFKRIMRKQQEAQDQTELAQESSAKPDGQ